MNTKAVARALSTLSLAIGELAEALDEQPAAPSAGVPGAAGGAPSVVPDGLPEIPPLLEEIYAEEIAKGKPLPPQGSLANCPKHHVPFPKGNYGLYCKHSTDDPAWGKQKGDTMWCTITPKNADVWLRAQAAVA